MFREWEGGDSRPQHPHSACFPPLPSSEEGTVIDDSCPLRHDQMLPCESRRFMSETSRASVGNLDPAQARELAVLVEMEARWENLRKTSSRGSGGRLTTPDLLGIQK